MVLVKNKLKTNKQTNKTNIFKTNIFVQNAIEVCRIASSRRSDCGGEPQRDASTKRAREWGREYCVFFPTYSTTKKGNYWESNKGRPAETINTKVSRKVNLIFYKLNLFPIFLVDKVKKKKKRKIVICRIMKNFYYHSGRCHAMRIQH